MIELNFKTGLTRHYWAPISRIDSCSCIIPLSYSVNSTITTVSSQQLLFCSEFLSQFSGCNSLMDHFDNTVTPDHPSEPPYNILSPSQRSLNNCGWPPPQTDYLSLQLNDPQGFLLRPLCLHIVLHLNSAAFIDLKISKSHIVHILFAVLQLRMRLQVLNAIGYLLYQLPIVINETFWCRLRARIKLCFHSYFLQSRLLSLCSPPH